MHNLYDIAMNNLSEYQRRYDSMSEEVKNTVVKLMDSAVLCNNMSERRLLSLLSDRLKNTFEFCADRNKQSLEQFIALPIEEQIELLCNGRTDRQTRIENVRRVDYSNRYENGYKFNYFAPYFNIGESLEKYGDYCVLIDPSISGTETVLKHDSIMYYYYDENTFDEDACHKDLLPYTHFDLLIADKYSDILSTSNLNSIKNDIGIDEDACEVTTTTKIFPNNMTAVLLSMKLWKEYTDLNFKKTTIGFTDIDEEERLESFKLLQEELDKYGVFLGPKNLLEDKK